MRGQCCSSAGCALTAAAGLIHLGLCPWWVKSCWSLPSPCRQWQRFMRKLPRLEQLLACSGSSGGAASSGRYCWKRELRGDRGKARCYLEQLKVFIAGQRSGKS